MYPVAGVPRNCVLWPTLDVIKCTRLSLFLVGGWDGWEQASIYTVQVPTNIGHILLQVPRNRVLYYVPTLDVIHVIKYIGHILWLVYLEIVFCVGGPWEQG